MHGNVNEWCWDRYADYPAGSVSDPGGPSSSRYPNRVMRGGSFNGYAWYCRAAYRSKKWQSHGDSPLGFRLALAPGRERVERAEVAVAAITAVAERVAVAVAAQAGAGEARTVPGIGIELVAIPAGSFVMGSPRGEDGRERNESQRAVTISRVFWLGKYEVTQGEWQSVMGSNPSYFAKVGKNAPVERVSWDDAQSFCGKLNASTEGSRPAGYAYCLPTEAEWEYACRAGTTGAWAGDFAAMAWSGHHTQEVGEKFANAWGLHDMHGNALEWCSDRYADYPAGSVTDPVGASSGQDRVCRGGSSIDPARKCRAAYRISYPPGSRSSTLGFRLALASGRERVERVEAAATGRVAVIAGEAERVAVLWRRRRELVRRGRCRVSASSWWRYPLAAS
jgi:formylglycine-generating enzyme required for sulfatase activity